MLSGDRASGTPVATFQGANRFSPEIPVAGVRPVSLSANAGEAVGTFCDPATRRSEWYSRPRPAAHPETPHLLEGSVTELDSLNPAQREAVLHTEGPLLILAGAGSGKTRVITFRIAYLIGNGHARPDEVLAVTFTNKAAQEMRERVEALIGEEAGGVWLSTFHSLCARLLRREAPKIGLSRDFVIYDSSDQVAVVKQAQRELGIDDKLVPPRMALSRISQAKNRMEGPDTLRGKWNLRDEQIAKIYEKYLTTLKDCNALDFDDLLLKTVELFESSEPTRN